MVPNDVSRCRGALMPFKMEPGPLNFGVELHSQCCECNRWVDIVDGHKHHTIDAPLGLLAKTDALCSARQNKP